jgi:hypothetical protein
MNRFNTVENKVVSMRSLLIATLLIGLVGGVSAQENVTAEDFQTPKPDVGFRMNPVDGLFDYSDFQEYEQTEISDSIYSDNGDYITMTATQTGYVADWGFGPTGNDEWTRGKIKLGYDTTGMDGDLNVNLVSNGFSSILESHNLETITAKEVGTVTIQWDEEDLIQDSNFDVTNALSGGGYRVGIQLKMDTQGDEVDIYEMDFIESQSTYTETFYNGTLSTPWNNPETTQINGERISQLDSEIVGSEGDYRWSVTTDSIYVAEYDLDNVNPQKLQYYMINASVPEGAELYYGLREEGKNTGRLYNLSEGLKISNSANGNSRVQPFWDNEILDTANTGIDTSMNAYHFQVGGLVSGERTFSSSNYDNSGQLPWTNFQKNGRPWYWRAGDISFNLPNPQNNEYDQVVIIMDSVDSGSHTFEISEMTYGPTVSELNPGSTIDIGPGEEVDPIEDRNEIVDGGIVDQGITTIANYLGIGLNATRFLLGILISLGVGLAAGWSEEYGSTTLGAVTFGFTFISLMLVGLIPMIYGLIFVLVAGGVGWLSWKNQSQKVVMNG